MDSSEINCAPVNPLTKMGISYYLGKPLREHVLIRLYQFNMAGVWETSTIKLPKNYLQSFLLTHTDYIIHTI